MNGEGGGAAPPAAMWHPKRTSGILAMWVKESKCWSWHVLMICIEYLTKLWLPCFQSPRYDRKAWKSTTVPKNFWWGLWVWRYNIGKKSFSTDLHQINERRVECIDEQADILSWQDRKEGKSSDVWKKCVMGDSTDVKSRMLEREEWPWSVLDMRSLSTGGGKAEE